MKKDTGGFVPEDIRVMRNWKAYLGMTQDQPLGVQKTADGDWIATAHWPNGALIDGGEGNTFEKAMWVLSQKLKPLHFTVA